MRKAWRDPAVGEVALGAFAPRWIAERELAPRTRELYQSLWRLHIEPFLGDYRVIDVQPADIRAWRSGLLENGVSATTAAKAYRLLRAIFGTAVDDLVVPRNPCRIKGADREPTRERSVATVAQVFALADAMPDRFRALVLLAAFVGLRWGELVALQRRDLDLEVGTVAVWRTYAQMQGGRMVLGPPKSSAGFRTMALPDVLVPVMREHLSQYVGSAQDAPVFVGERGALLKRGNFRRSVRWDECLRSVGLPAGFHFHDLRHTGNTLTARSGASTRELMHRMGHDSVRAALIYQHATNDRDREIARAVSARVQVERERSSGTQRARRADCSQVNEGKLS